MANAGSYTSKDGATSQELCPAGTISSPGQSKCDKCPAGKHAAAAGSTTCQEECSVVSCKTLKKARKCKQAGCKWKKKKEKCVAKK